jgi:hypothetical protein
MINGTFDQISLNERWRAFFEKRRQLLESRDYPGMTRTRAAVINRQAKTERKSA